MKKIKNSVFFDEYGKGIYGWHKCIIKDSSHLPKNEYEVECVFNKKSSKNKILRKSLYIKYQLNYNNIYKNIIMIRILNKFDYLQYFELINIFRKTSFSEEDFINYFINTTSNIWIIELNNKIIATGTILYEHKFIHNISKIAHIEDVCVHNDFRGKNYGKIMINHLIDQAKKENCYKVTLYCKEDLEKFYNSCNMEKNGIQMAIYFQKQLFYNYSVEGTFLKLGDPIPVHKSYPTLAL